ncbi:MAG TPA: response regulator [Cyclobacteriaceae bacterium]
MGRTILVVEDFESIRKFVRSTLEQKGYQTFGAADGNEAYTILTERPDEVDLVLTDYHMPDGTGYDLLKKMKENTALHKVPVIFLTTEQNPQKIALAEEAGLFAWLKKPYRTEILFSKIESAFNSTEKHDN